MNPFEYALGLISILMSLALADIALSLHRVMRHCGSVRWDGRVLLSAALVVLTIVRMWFSVWQIREVEIVLGFLFYLSLFVEFMILVLLAAACLPDEATADCDLGRFYDGNRRYLWLVFAVFHASYFGHWLFFGGMEAGPWEWAQRLWPLAAFLTLAFWSARWFHYAAPAALIFYYLWVYAPLSLGSS